MSSVVAERGQVTIPKALREKLGIVPGTVLHISLRAVNRARATTPPAPDFTSSLSANAACP